MKKKLVEGDIFSFPIVGRKDGLGVVVRVGINGVPLGYFFGPTKVMMLLSTKKGWRRIGLFW